MQYPSLMLALQPRYKVSQLSSTGQHDGSEPILHLVQHYQLVAIYSPYSQQCLTLVTHPHREARICIAEEFLSLSLPLENFSSPGYTFFTYAPVPLHASPPTPGPYLLYLYLFPSLFLLIPYVLISSYKQSRRFLFPAPIFQRYSIYSFDAPNGFSTFAYFHLANTSDKSIFNFRVSILSYFLIFYWLELPHQVELSTPRGRGVYTCVRLRGNL